jgi:hypothetical protein
MVINEKLRGCASYNGHNRVCKNVILSTIPFIYFMISARTDESHKANLITS